VRFPPRRFSSRGNRWVFLTQPADRRKGSHQSDVCPVACHYGQPGSPCPTASTQLAPAARFGEQLLLACLSGVEHLGRGRPAGGATRGMCVGSSAPTPAEQLPCYKTQLLLFWYFTQLSTPQFFVSKPDCFVPPSCFLASTDAHASVCAGCVGSGGWPHAPPRLVHHLPGRTIVMICTTARQTHCKDGTLALGPFLTSLQWFFLLLRNELAG